MRVPRLPLGLGVILTLLGVCDGSEAQEAEVTVDRALGAEQCPDAQALQLAIERVGVVPEGPRPDGELRLHVSIGPTGGGFRAEIRATGRKTGVRTLDVPGDCDALTDAVAVTLALLLDRELRDSEPDPQPLPPEPEPADPLPAPVANPPQPSAREPVLPTAAPPPSSRWQGGVTLGGGVTHGLPHGWSGMPDGELWVRDDAYSLALGGFWAPTRTVSFAPGTVEVRLLGGRVRGCGLAWGTWEGVHLGGCVEGVVGQLRGRGDGFATNRTQQRPWYALGASVSGGGPIHGTVGWAFGAGVLAPVQRESFSVDRVGRAYEADAVAFFAGPSLVAQIF